MSNKRRNKLVGSVEHAISERPMNWRGWLLLLVLLGQLLVLAGVLGMARYPLWAGRDVALEVVPVDPRDLFRGNYARLEYAITTLDAGLLVSQESSDYRAPLQAGSRVYVMLEQAANDDNTWHATAIYRQRPDSGVFVRGRIMYRSGDILRLRYGIEAWFAPKDKALALEHDLMRGGIAHIRVTDGGQAALHEITPPTTPPE